MSNEEKELTINKINEHYAAIDKLKKKLQIALTKEIKETKEWLNKMK